MEAQITDITAGTPDLNPWDKVYRLKRQAVKVKVEDRSRSPGMVCVTVTGSWVIESTGKARAFGNGHFIVDPLDLTFNTESPVDLAEEIEAARLNMVRRVLVAVEHQKAKDALTGIKPRGLAGLNPEAVRQV